MIVLAIIAICFVLWLIIKPYIIKHDTCTLYVGGLGSGKTLVGVSDSLRCLKRMRFKVWFYNLFHPFKKKPKPLLYSNIPIRVSRREMSAKLKLEHLLLKEKMIEKSVCFIDEASTVANSFETVANNQNLKVVELWSTLYRHFTKGGFLILTTQNTSKCNYIIRYCCNQAYQLSQFRSFPIPLIGFWFNRIRNIDMTNDVVNISQNNIEENTRVLFGFFGRRKYDTYCFSEIVSDLPLSDPEEFSASLKTTDFVIIPRKK